MNKSLNTILNLYSPQVLGLIYCLDDKLTFQSEEYFNLFYLTNGLIKNHLELLNIEDPLILTHFFNQDTFIKVLNIKKSPHILETISSLKKSLPKLFNEKKIILIQTTSPEMLKKIEKEISPALKNLNLEIKLVI